MAAGAGYLAWKADRKRSVPFPWMTAALRALVIFATCLLLLEPSLEVSRHLLEKPVVLLLQDNSVSVGVALGHDSAGYRKDFSALKEKLSHDYNVVQWGFGGRIQSDSFYQYHQQVTDISAALARAQEYFGLQNLGAVVLASDGRYNEGLNPLYQDLSFHCPVYTLAIGDSQQQKDLRIAQVYANKTVALNSTFEIRADLVASLCRNYNNALILSEGAATISSTPVAIDRDRYDRTFSFSVKAGKPGLHHYVLSVPGADGEANLANNRRDVFVDVTEDKKQILIVSAAPHPDINALKEALAGVEGYKVTLATADNIPASFAGYQVLIFHGLPSLQKNISAQIAAAHRPVWFILSAQADLNTMNRLEDITQSVFQPSSLHDVDGKLNPAFNTFLLPEQAAAVTDKMPPLGTRTAGVTASPGAFVLFTQTTWEGEPAPLWWLQPGPTPCAVLAGEGLWRWRLHEFKNFSEHKVVDEFIRQTVAFLAANSHEQPFNLVLSKYVWSDQEPVAVGAYLLDANNEQINSPDVQCVLADSSGREHPFAMERSGTVYNLNLGVWAEGAYTFKASAKWNGKTYVASRSFRVERRPLEQMETGADYPLLYGLARKYGGAFFTPLNSASIYDSIAHNEKIKPLIRTVTESSPLVDRKWYFFLILALATAEWLLRKYWLAQ